MSSKIRQIILDTETTGLYPNRGDRLIEFAGLELIDRQMTGNNLHLYVHPERDIPDEAVAVHGLTLEKLAHEPVFANVGQQIADFIRGAELIIHNAKFDEGFLDMEFTRMGLPTVRELGCSIIDTLAMAREQFPGQKASLDALCTRLDVDRSKRVLHGALIDCELLACVYLAMTCKQHSLDENLSDAVKETLSQQAVSSINRPHSLQVKYADPQEQAAHQDYLLVLDKEAGGSCVWRD